CILFAFLLVFFFQAEDGIRDGHVTGVQTCALPICAACQRRRREKRRAPSRSSPQRSFRFAYVSLPSRRLYPTPSSRRKSAACLRSEERRVGKECRYWWRAAPDKHKRQHNIKCCQRI